MIAVIVGLVFLALGGFGLLYWIQDFLVVARGFGPFSLLVGGIVSLIAGIASFRSTPKDDGGKD